MQLVLASPTWFCCFSGLRAETRLRPGCHVQGGKVREKRSLWGWGSCFPSFALCQDPVLHLGVNCLATVFRYLSQLPYPTCQGIFLVFYYPVSFSPQRVPTLKSFMGDEGRGSCLSNCFLLTRIVVPASIRYTSLFLSDLRETRERDLSLE